MNSSPAVFDFDHPPHPLKDSSVKWHRYGSRDIIPLWVADMDFASPPAVIQALQERVSQGTFGYALASDQTNQTIVRAMQDRYDWQIDSSWIVWLPGLVCGLNIVAQAFAQPGEEILTLSPTYPPFLTAGKNVGRIVRPVSLVLNPSVQQWEIDWPTLEARVTSKTKIFLLCSPQNPVAKIWRTEELRKIGDFCLRHQLILCSDEIHCDLILDPDVTHVPTAKIDHALSLRTVTLMAPSKTYNLPGLGTAFAIIQDPAVRARFNHTKEGIVPGGTGLGYVGCEAAYRLGEPWRLELLSYLRRNRDFLLDFLAREIPLIKVDAPIEATYLAWLNVKELKLTDPTAHFEKFGVGLQEGANFGAPRNEFARLSFACARSTLEEALARMKKAANSLPN